jgi:hypothetical protein
MSTAFNWTPWRRRLSTWHRPVKLMLRAGPHAPAQPDVVAAAVAAFAAWASEHAGAVVELKLSSHFLLMGADADASDADALRASVAERWAHYLDLNEAELQQAWCVQTTLDLGAAPVAVACALPRALVEGLQEVARQHRLRLLALQPWWVEDLMAAWQALPRVSAGDEAVDAVQHWAWAEGDWQTRVSAEPMGRSWRLRELNWGVGASVVGATVSHPVPRADHALGAAEVLLVEQDSLLASGARHSTGSLGTRGTRSGVQA